MDIGMAPSTSTLSKRASHPQDPVVYRLTVDRLEAGSPCRTSLGTLSGEELRRLTVTIQPGELEDSGHSGDRQR